MKLKTWMINYSNKNDLFIQTIKTTYTLKNKTKSLSLTYRILYVVKF